MSLRVVLACSWTIVILIACWTPASYVPEARDGPKRMIIPHLDKMIHFGMFTLFGVFWMRVEDPKSRGRRVALAGGALAVLSELGQAVPIIHRDPGIVDTAADLLGLGTGIAAFALASRKIA